MMDSRFKLNFDLIPSDRQDLLKQIAAAATLQKLPLYIVGGFVRDLLLQRPVNDFDVVVEGDAIGFGHSLVKQYGGKLTTHPKFHTAIWHIPGEAETIDLITARKELYTTPGALPTVTPSTIKDDLHRRDFTINAMAVRIDGEHYSELLDPLNGRDDLENKVIRILHPRSFIDDPTRIFRAIRYEGRYSFQLESATLRSINSESTSIIMRLSGERIRHELDLIFEEENSAEMIVRVGNFGLCEAIHPKLDKFDSGYASLLKVESILDIPHDKALMGYMIWFMNLAEDDILSISRRLDFSSDMSHAVWAVAQLKKSLPFLINSRPSVWTFALEKLPPLSIYVVYLISGEHALLDYLSVWRHVKSHTTGEDLKARGLIPGPHFGEILQQLRAGWLDGEINSFEQEQGLLERLIKLNS